MGVLFYNNKVLDSANYLTRLESVTNVARRNGISGSFLSALPEELKIRILHHLSDRADFNSVQLVDKEFHALAIPLLYADFALVLSPHLSPQMSDKAVHVLSNRSEGHNYIRKLKISLDVPHDRNPGRAFQWLDMALDQIPEDTLARFDSTFHRPYPPHTQKKLWKSQKKLQNIELFSSSAIDEEYFPTVEDSTTNLGSLLQCLSFEHLKAIRTTPDGPSAASLCRTALQQGAPGAIEALEIDGRHWIDADEFKHRTLPNTKSNQLVESLFAHIPRVGFGQKGNLDYLSTLKLKDVDLAESKYTWYTYLSVGNLTHLEIHHCEGAHVFLTNLIKGDEASDPALTTLHVVSYRNVGLLDRIVEAIDHLLKSIQTGIFNLHLCLKGLVELPDATAIARHGASLRKLLLGFNLRIDPPAFPYEQEDLRNLIQPCTQLEELAIPVPDMHLEYDIQSEDGAYLEQYVSTIAECCRKLKVSITELPHHNNPYRKRELLAEKDHSLERLAADIFRRTLSVDDRDPTCRIQPLEVVAFGIRERTPRDIAPRFFVPCVYKALNMTRRGVMRVKLSDLRKHGLSADILEYERRDWDLNSRRMFHSIEQEDQDDDPGFRGYSP